QPQHRKRHDGSGDRGGDGEAGLQSQVRVGSAQDDGQQHTEDDDFQRDFREGGRRRDERSFRGRGGRRGRRWALGGHAAQRGGPDKKGRKGKRKGKGRR